MAVRSPSAVPFNQIHATVGGHIPYQYSLGLTEVSVVLRFYRLTSINDKAEWHSPFSIEEVSNRWIGKDLDFLLIYFLFF